MNELVESGKDLPNGFLQCTSFLWTFGTVGDMIWWFGDLMILIIYFWNYLEKFEKNIDSEKWKTSFFNCTSEEILKEKLFDELF